MWAFLQNDGVQETPVKGADNTTASKDILDNCAAKWHSYRGHAVGP